MGEKEEKLMSTSEVGASMGNREAKDFEKVLRAGVRMNLSQYWAQRGRKTLKLGTHSRPPTTRMRKKRTSDNEQLRSVREKEKEKLHANAHCKREG